MDIKQEKDVKKINFKDIIEQCQLFIKGDLSQEGLENFCDKIYFKTYLPLEEKIILINKVVKSFYDEDDVDLMTIQFELYKFYIILIGGYTNIYIDEEDGTIENYNICYSCLGNWMLTICGIDYQKTIDMLKDYIRLSNINEVLLMATKINNTSFDEYNKTQKKMFNWIKKNPDIIKDIKDLTQFNDPITKEFLDNVKKKTINDLNDEKNKKNKKK